MSCVRTDERRSPEAGRARDVAAECRRWGCTAPCWARCQPFVAGILILCVVCARARVRVCVGGRAVAERADVVATR